VCVDECVYGSHSTDNSVVPTLLPLQPFPLLAPSLPLLEQKYWSNNRDCSHFPNDDKLCQDALSKAALVRSIVGGVGAALMFFLAPMIGRVSDSFGRRPLLMVASLLALPSPIALILYDFFDVPFWWYYGADFLRSVSPGIVAVFAYLADIVAPEARGRTFGFFLGGFSFASIVCPLVSTVLSLRQVFVVNVVCAVALVLYTFVFIGESLQDSLKQPWHSAEVFCVYLIVCFLQLFAPHASSPGD
jgi:MFS family permease